MRRSVGCQPGVRRLNSRSESLRRFFGCVGRAQAVSERRAVRASRDAPSSNSQRDFLLGLVEQTPDMTIVEMQQQLAAERGIKVSVGTIWTFLDRCGLTFKKSRRTRRSGIGPTS